MVEQGLRVRSSVIASQLDVHARYGGVVPELASREHLRAIVPVIRQALADAGCNYTELRAIAVTSGPGLVGSLLVGVTYAKGLCLATGLPLIGVNHIEGHIHSVLIENHDVQFPALALVVSGGHTHLFAVEQLGSYKLLGKTRDDAAGEAYDKVAKLLGFGYPGGPILDQLASFGNSEAVRFKPVRIRGSELDFSFSGLKTAVLRWTESTDITAEIKNRKQNTDRSLNGWLRVTPARTLDLIASFQKTVVNELLRRALLSADQIGAESILVSGGVAANRGLRAAAATSNGFRFHFPSNHLATDNAAMIAAAAFQKWERGETAGFDLKPQAGLVLA